MIVPSIGDKIADADLLDLNGNETKLSEYNDKHVLLSFWSLTCMICMKASGELSKLHEQYKDKLNIVSINMDIDKTMWEKGTNRDSIIWTNLSDGKGVFSGVGKLYRIVSYPSYVLINTEGIIIDRWMGYKPGRFEEKMKNHLG